MTLDKYDQTFIDTVKKAVENKDWVTVYNYKDYVSDLKGIKPKSGPDICVNNTLYYRYHAYFEMLHAVIFAVYPKTWITHFIETGEYPNNPDTRWIYFTKLPDIEQIKNKLSDLYQINDAQWEVFPVDLKAKPADYYDFYEGPVIAQYKTIITYDTINPVCFRTLEKYLPKNFHISK